MSFDQLPASNFAFERAGSLSSRARAQRGKLVRMRKNVGFVG
jgi:hypothetical protein